MYSILRRLREALSWSRDSREAKYKIYIQDGHNFVYVEDDHKLLIRGEMLTGETNFVVYTSYIDRWCSPYDHERIEAQEKQIILHRLHDYMEQQRIKYEIE